MIVLSSPYFRNHLFTSIIPVKLTNRTTAFSHARSFPPKKNKATTSKSHAMRYLHKLPVTTVKRRKTRARPRNKGYAAALPLSRQIRRANESTRNCREAQECADKARGRDAGKKWGRPRRAVTRRFWSCSCGHVH